MRRMRRGFCVLLFLAAPAGAGMAPTDPPGDDPQAVADTERVCGEGERLYLGNCVVNPKPIRRVNPSFPKRARKAGVTGFVRLKAVILKSGKVVDPEVLEADPQGYGLEEAAIRAVKKWKYVPARVNGKIEDVYFTVNVAFGPCGG